MDVFQAFRAPGQFGVHSSLMIAYCLPGSGRMVHHAVCGSYCHSSRKEDGIDQSTWEYMALLDLFNTVARAMKQGAARGNCDRFTNNCIHFKNDILSALNFHRDRYFTNKTNIQEYDLCS
eukprot:GFUD01090449.1.p1 GENE.GFUD01090449.1~~GFUD01090449.1.p1  ORF type:complete len:120 (+),score=18.09 GFUD01090449.1:39-398(+)